MTQAISVLALSVTASTAITAERFVTATGAVATAAGNAFGVARSQAASGELFTTDVLGTAIVVAEEAIAAGALVEVGATGKAAAKSAGVTVARALQAAAADGDRIEVLLIAN